MKLSERLGRRNVVIAALVALAAVLVFGAWLGFQALAAKNGLEQARTSAQQAKDALLDGQTAEASRFADEAQSSAQSARGATHSVPWSIAAAVPLLGSPFKSGQQISDVVLDLSANVLKPTAEAGVNVAPQQLLADGRLDVEALREQEPALSRIAADAARINTDAQAITRPRFLSVVGDARSTLQAQTRDLSNLLGNTAIAAKLAPPLMGADGPRNYFMGFQTPAEARGTGGLLGGFGILRFDDGRATVDTLGANNELDGPFRPFSLGEEFDEIYGFTNPTTDYRNSNQSAHFPYAAEIWTRMWEQQNREQLDGAIAIDPIALSYILGATGPVRMPDGETVTQANVVELTLSTVYSRFPTDQAARKKYLQDIAAAVVTKITEPIESPRELFDALGKAVSERRIAVWSANPADQKLLEETPLAFVIPEDPAPLAEVVINNLGGNKMDYYLTRKIEYVADRCSGDTRASTVTVVLTNTLPPEDADKLPPYVVERLGFYGNVPGDIPKGTMITSVRLLATQGASLRSFNLDGTRSPVIGTMERGHPSFEVNVAIPPGGSTELVFQLTEPTAPGEARVPIQPLVDNPTPVVSVPACA